MATYFDKNRTEIIREAIYDKFTQYTKDRHGYGTGTDLNKPAPAKRTNAAERRKALEALDDTTLSAKLEPLLKQEYGAGPDDLVEIRTSPAAGRYVYFSLRGGSDSGTDNLHSLLNRWQKDKSLEPFYEN